MELQSDVKGSVFSSGTSNTRQFSMKLCAKAFDAQIAGLYSDKIKAVVRELSTNAYEAHQLLKIESQPFNVKLPSEYDPIFKIRDFGPGISDDDIGSIYITLYESTKDTSNEFGGAFGLGSKSPYAYSSNFSVTSIHNGVKTIYALSRDSNGIPCITTLMSSKTTEQSGIEIEIPVNKYDINKFLTAAQNVYKYFKTKPNVTGNINYSPLTQEKEIVSGTKWRLTASTEYPVAIMGNIAYPITHYNGTHKDFITKRGLVLDFNIGELEPTPSRESLSFTQETIDAITRRLETVSVEYSKIIQKEIDKCDNFWNACIKFKHLKNNALLPVKCTFNGDDVDLYSISTIDKTSKYPYTNFVPSLQSINGYNKNSYSTEAAINISDKTKVIVNDKPSYVKIRIKDYRFNGLNGAIQFYIVDESELPTLKKIMRCDDSLFILASSLPKPTINRTSSSKKSKVLEYVLGGSHNNQCWIEAEIDDTTEGYFVNIKNNKIIFDKNEYSPVTFAPVLKCLINLHGKTFKLYGIKSGGESENLDPLLSLINTHYNEILSSHDTYEQAKNIYNQCSSLNYNMLCFLSNKTLNKINHPELKSLLAEYEKVNNNRIGAISHDVVIIVKQILPNRVFTPKTQQKSNLQSQIIDFEKKYPLVSLIARGLITDVYAKELEFYLIGRNI